MLVQGIEESIVSESINLLMKFAKLLIMIFIIAHWIACLLFSIGEYEFEDVGDSWILKNQL
jgi:type III secretory pathway component EscS